MEFLIFSDSHGKYYGAIEAYERQVKKPDAVLFLGDGLRDLRQEDFHGSSFFAVRGNCDFLLTSAAPDEELLSFEGHKIFLCHGHTYGVKGGLGALISHAAKAGADIVLFGHTHQAYEGVINAGEVVGGVPLSRPMYLFNPGSLAAGQFGTLSLKGDAVLFGHGDLK